jgi:hypothetical protein
MFALPACSGAASTPAGAVIASSQCEALGQSRKREVQAWHFAPKPLSQRMQRRETPAQLAQHYSET